MTTRRQILTLVAVPLLGALLAVGIRTAWSRPAPPPLLECPELIDLGERERGEIVLCHFQVGNSGGSPLILDRFQTSCSCAGVERRVDGRYVIPESVTLEPGQQLELSVRVSVGAPQGERQRVGVVFQSNDPVRPTHGIEVLVPRVKGGVYAQPKAVILGSVPLGEPATRILELYDTGRPGRKIATVRSTYPDRFDVRLIPLGKDEPPRRHASAGNLIARLEVTAHTERSGPLDGDVEIVLANEERPPDHIPVVGDVVPSVICRPERLVLHGRRAQGAGYAGEILVASRDGKPVQVAIEALPPRLTATVRAVPGRNDRVVLDVKYKKGSAATPEPGSDLTIPLRIRVNDRDVREDVSVVIGGPSS